MAAIIKGATTIKGVTTVGFSPASLFAAGEQGVWYDPSDFSTMFQDAAGTTPVTAVEQSVGLIKDKSGRGNNATQSTAGSRPVLSARVNLLTKTEKFDDAVWVKSNISASATSATSDPIGTNTASKAIALSSGSNPFIYYPYAGTNGAAHTISIYAKKAELNWIRLTNSFATLSSAWFNLNTGAVGTIIGSGNTASITPVGNGWYRCVLNVTVGIYSASTTSVVVAVTNGDNVTTGYTGDNVSGVYIWGADLRVSNDGVGLPDYQRVNTSTDYDTVGFPYYLNFDGVDDGLVSANVNFSATDKMTVFSGVRKVGSTAGQSISELTTSSSANNGAFTLYADPGATAGPGYAWASKGTVRQFPDIATGYPRPITNTLTGIGDISGSSAILRVNGSQVASSALSQGTGNYSNAPIYIASRSQSTLFFAGRLYSFIARGAASSAQQIAATEGYVNQKTRAY